MGELDSRLAARSGRPLNRRFGKSGLFRSQRVSVRVNFQRGESILRPSVEAATTI